MVVWKVSLKVVLLGNFGYLLRQTALGSFTLFCVFNNIFRRKKSYILTHRKKLDRVGPIDTRPSMTSFTTLSEKIFFLHVMHDT